MRVTVCELPHEPRALGSAWDALCEHTALHASELVLLPEFAMVEALWQDERVDAARWEAAAALSDLWRRRLCELRAPRVVATRPVTLGGRPFNQGFLWTAPGDLLPLRRKFFRPEEPGSWEARWFDRGDAEFAAYAVAGWSFGLNICTELWALETYAAYAARGVQMILAPRATEARTLAKWLAVGVVAAVRSGAWCLSSNRVDPTGTFGGGGWIIDPYGEILARTTWNAPFATLDLDLAAPAAAREAYPGYVFAGS
ncbi:MAG: carbon-nitrogen hydrolase family protein [Thermoanaerobaculia bacterium]